MLTRTGSAVRAGATVVFVLLLVIGSAWGDDDHFPFAPFKMYSRATPMDGVVGSPQLVGFDRSGREHRIWPGALGMRQAELEGQYRWARDDPGLLGVMAEAYGDATGVRLVEMRLLRVRRHLEGGRVVDQTTSLVASWRDEP